MKRLLLVITIFLCHTALSQTFSFSDRLYYTAKVWGFVKYYHSEVSICHVNWDSVLLHVLPMARTASTDDQFNDAIDTLLAAAGPMAIATSPFPDILPIRLKRNRDWAWIDSSPLRPDVKIQLGTIRNNFRPHVGCWAMAGGSSGYLNLPYDSVELSMATIYGLPDIDHRYLMLFKYWNVVRYFNPYNYVLDVPWDTTLYNNVIPIDTVSSSYNLYLLLRRIFARLDDAHTDALSYSFDYELPNGYSRPKIRLKRSQGQYIVIKSMEPLIHPGDVITRVDGHNMIEIEDSLRQFFSAGNDAVFGRIMCENILNRKTNVAEDLTIVDSSGVESIANVYCGDPSYHYYFFYNTLYVTDSLANTKWTTMPCDIGYVNLGNLSGSEIDPMYADLKNKPAIIFDLRNGLIDDMSAIMTWLSPDYRPFSKLTFPDFSYPGTYTEQTVHLGIAGNPYAYERLVIILLDENTQSALEYTAMMFDALPNTIKVGSQTAGADGNISKWRVTLDIPTGISTLGVYYPNGDSTQRIGIIPDSTAYPTPTGVRNHRDEVLEKALLIAGCPLEIPNHTIAPNFRISPNPSDNSFFLVQDNLISGPIQLTIVNMLGQTVIETSFFPTSKKMEIPYTGSLTPGTYIVRISGMETERSFVIQKMSQ